jgi:hypothetical protein
MAAKKLRRAKNPGRKREDRIDINGLKKQLQEMKGKLREMMKAEGLEIGPEDVQTAKDFAEQMQEINRGLRESLKRAMMADGKIKPGQVLTFRGRRVFLKERPGCSPGSMNPDDYDLTYEHIH